jgi:hypothetical protein
MQGQYFVPAFLFIRIPDNSLIATLLTPDLSASGIFRLFLRA